MEGFLSAVDMATLIVESEAMLPSHGLDCVRMMGETPFARGVMDDGVLGFSVDDNFPTEPTREPTNGVAISSLSLDLLVPGISRASEVDTIDPLELAVIVVLVSEASLYLLSVVSSLSEPGVNE